MGFIALTAAILLSALILIISVAVSQTSYLARFDVLTHEFKKTSLALAETCANTALLNLGKNPDYVPLAGGDEVTVGENSCRICDVETDPGDDTIKTIKARASLKETVTNLEITADYDSDDYDVDFWGEKADYIGPLCTVL